MNAVKHRARRFGGFTVIEVMVSLLILVLVVAGGYSLIARAANLSRAARHHYVAISLAKNRIERTRNFEFKDLNLLGESDVVMDANGSPVPSGWYSRTTTVSTNYGPGLTEIVVTVKIRNMKTGGFGTEQESLRTLLADGAY